MGFVLPCRPTASALSHTFSHLFLSRALSLLSIQQSLRRDGNSSGKLKFKRRTKAHQSAPFPLLSLPPLSDTPSFLAPNILLSPSPSNHHHLILHSPMAPPSPTTTDGSSLPSETWQSKANGTNSSWWLDRGLRRLNIWWVPFPFLSFPFLSSFFYFLESSSLRLLSLS